jgi:hypothetical protein
MKVSMFTLVAAGVLAASQAFADDGASFVNGDWIGTGTFQMGADVVACSEVKMRFSGSKDTYVVREASMICGNAPKQDFTAVDSFAVSEDGQITFDGGTNTTLAKGTKVGSVKDDVLHNLNPIDTGGVDDITLRRAGDFLIYNQIAGAPGKSPDYALLAIMKRDPNAAAKP